MFTRILQSVLIICIVSCNEVKEVNALNVNTNVFCLVKSFSVYEYALKGSAESSCIFDYNSEGKVISKLLTSSTKYTYQENKANLGSDSKPYVTRLLNGALSSKYFCDNNARVNRVEYFDSPDDKFPSSIDYSEYDGSGNEIKTTSKYYNKITGEITKNYDIYEAEYSNGNMIKEYETHQFNNIQIKRHLSAEYIANTKIKKEKIVYFYNFGSNSFGSGDKYHTEKKLKYNDNGILKTQGTFAYKFDNNDYLLSKEINFTDGSSEKYFDYTYQCK